MGNRQHSYFDKDYSTREKRIVRICERMRGVPFSLPVLKVPFADDAMAVPFTDDWVLNESGKRPTFGELTFIWHNETEQYLLSSK